MFRKETTNGSYFDNYIISDRVLSQKAAKSSLIESHSMGLGFRELAFSGALWLFDCLIIILK